MKEILYSLGDLLKEGKGFIIPTIIITIVVVWLLFSNTKNSNDEKPKKELDQKRP